MKINDMIVLLPVSIITTALKFARFDLNSEDKKFIAENIANENVVRFADFLIYTLASAQIQYMADDEEKLFIMDNILSTMSANIRNLLKN